LLSDRKAISPVKASGTYAQRFCSAIIDGRIPRENQLTQVGLENGCLPEIVEMVITVVYMSDV